MYSNFVFNMHFPNLVGLENAYCQFVMYQTKTTYFAAKEAQTLTARGLGCAAEDWNSMVSSCPSASLSSLEIRP